MNTGPQITHRELAELSEAYLAELNKKLHEVLPCEAACPISEVAHHQVTVSNLIIQVRAGIIEQNNPFMLGMFDGKADQACEQMQDVGAYAIRGILDEHNIPDEQRQEAARVILWACLPPSMPWEAVTPELVYEMTHGDGGLANIFTKPLPLVQPS